MLRLYKVRSNAFSDKKSSTIRHWKMRFYWFD